MDTQPIPFFELLGFILFLGSITFLSGAVFQVLILIRNKKSLVTISAIVILTRLVTITGSFFTWAYWPFSSDVMFLFLFLPALLPEIIFSPLFLKISGNTILNRTDAGRQVKDSVYVKPDK